MIFLWLHHNNFIWGLWKSTIFRGVRKSLAFHRWETLVRTGVHKAVSPQSQPLEGRFPPQRGAVQFGSKSQTSRSLRWRGKKLTSSKLLKFFGEFHSFSPSPFITLSRHHFKWPTVLSLKRLALGLWGWLVLISPGGSLCARNHRYFSNLCAPHFFLFFLHCHLFCQTFFSFLLSPDSFHFCEELDCVTALVSFQRLEIWENSVTEVLSFVNRICWKV